MSVVARLTFVRVAATTALLLLVLLAGCFKVEIQAPDSQQPLPADGAPSTYRVACALVDENRTPLKSGSCTYSFGKYGVTAAVDHNGTAARSVPAGLSGTLSGAAPGRIGQTAKLTIDGPKSVRMTLPRLTAGAHGSVSGSPSVSIGPGEDGGVTLPPVPVEPRTWLPAVPVIGDGSGAEPQLAVAPDGTIYYSPLSSIYRSTDGGRSFQEITPGLPDAGPVLASDTAVTVAPDGSVWFSDDWPYAGHTQACTSTDKGTTWTCSAFALPGATDRMWIAGRSATDGFLETGQALQQPNWLKTTTGSLAYTPYAAGVLSQYGNMVYDEVHDAVWQISGGDPQSIARVDDALGTVGFRSTSVPGTYAIAWLAVSNGTLWTTGEKNGQVLAARSTDQGVTWDQFPVTVEPKMATFSYIAAHGQRAAVVYYGSDKPGDSPSNGGHWSLYVAETDNALDPEPTWIETKLVEDIHDGNLCIGLNCEQSGGDGNARMAGDLIGIALDGDGNVHVAYVRDAKGSFPNEYRRQIRS